MTGRQVSLQAPRSSTGSPASSPLRSVTRACERLERLSNVLFCNRVTSREGFRQEREGVGSEAAFVVSRRREEVDEQVARPPGLALEEGVGEECGVYAADAAHDSNSARMSCILPVQADMLWLRAASLYNSS